MTIIIIIISRFFYGLRYHFVLFYCIQVLKLSQFYLLQTAADDAIVRLQKSVFTDEEKVCLTNWYYRYQQHTSIGEFLQYNCCKQSQEVFMQVF